MAAEKIRFNQKTIDALGTDSRGAVRYIFDTETRGLCLVITASGVKTYYVRRKYKGRSLRVLIGRADEFKVERARARADEINAAFGRNENPHEERQNSRHELTLGQLYDQFRERHLLPYRKPATIEVYEWQYQKHLARFKAHQLSDISRRQVQELHAKIGAESGHYSANRVVALLSAMFNKAAAWGYWKGDNPAKGIERFRERSRERFLVEDELPRFFKALAEEENKTTRDCIALCLFTGARRGNVQAMRWDELALDDATWHIPDTKSGTQVALLVPSAMSLLRERLLTAGDSPWVFPAANRKKHIVELRYTWHRVLNRAGLRDLRPHDLRRTLGSWQAITGASLTVIGKSLGHKSLSTTLIYSRLSQEPVRESLERAEAAILAAAGEGERGLVIPQSGVR